MQEDEQALPIQTEVQERAGNIICSGTQGLRETCALGRRARQAFGMEGKPPGKLPDDGRRTGRRLGQLGADPETGDHLRRHRSGEGGRCRAADAVFVVPPFRAHNVPGWSVRRVCGKAVGEYLMVIVLIAVCVPKSHDGRGGIIASFERRRDLYVRPASMDIGSEEEEEAEECTFYSPAFQKCAEATDPNEMEDGTWVHMEGSYDCEEPHYPDQGSWGDGS